MSVLVIGSCMMDHTAKTSRFPEPGEAVRGHSFGVFPGGKGINQAVAAKRLGSDVFFFGAVGDDAYGYRFLSILEKEGISHEGVLVVPGEPTGASLIPLDEKTGQNRIICCPGANLSLEGEDLKDQEDIFEQVSLVMVQLETAVPTVLEAAKLAKKHKKLFILNPAPAETLPDEIFPMVDYFTPNETEAFFYSGKEDPAEAAKEILKKGVKNVIVTLGDKGCLFANGKEMIRLPALRVKAVDTVGAGDVFNGAIAFSLDRGISIEKALKIAIYASAMSVTKPGALPSIPTLEELMK